MKAFLLAFVLLALASTFAAAYDPSPLQDFFVAVNDTLNGGNTRFTKVLYKDDVFVFPLGLIHFQFNIGETNAVAFSGLSGQNPDVIAIANTISGSDPDINPDFLARAFQLDVNVVKSLQATFNKDCWLLEN